MNSFQASYWLLSLTGFSVLLASPVHSIINRVGSWSGVKFGVKFRGDFGVEFGNLESFFHESWPGETGVRRLK